MIKALDHIGISVANLERSIAFYQDGLGLEVVDHALFAGSEYEQILALKGVRGRTAMLKKASLQIELFEFEIPRPQRLDAHRPVCDHGLSHFCITVGDIHQVYERLLAAGATFHCPPLKCFGVATVTYGRDPDGNVFELLEMHEGSE